MRIDPPVPILDVLEAALAALHNDGRFSSVPGGRIEVAWMQPTRARNGLSGRPARYCLVLECLFTPRDAAKEL